MSLGRPIEWTKEKKDNAIEIIFKEMIEGKSIASILKSADRNILPSPFTFYEWLQNDKDLSNNYARILHYRAEMLFDELLTIADTTVKGKVIETDDNGRTKEKIGDMLGHRRLQIDARKWVLAKMNPKKYGDKLESDIHIDTSNKKLKILFDDDEK